MIQLLSEDAARELQELIQQELLIYRDLRPVVDAFIRTGDATQRSAIFSTTLLHLACMERKPALVACLLEQGADPNAERPYWEPAVDDGTYMDVSCPLEMVINGVRFARDEDAAVERVCRIVSLLLAAGADPNRRYSAPSGQTRYGHGSLGNAGKTVARCLSVRSPRLAAWLESRGIITPQS